MVSREKQIENRFIFYDDQILTARLKMLKSLAKGNDYLTLVIGEKGSGKTTLLHRLLTDLSEEWRYCQILFHSKKDISKVKALGNLHERKGVLLKTGLPPVLIIDDAHEINIKGLCYLLGHTLITSGTRKFRSVILFCEPPVKGFIEKLSESIPNKSVTNKIYNKPFNIQQTTRYLHYLFQYSHLSSKKDFSASQIKKIHDASQGLPGKINQEAQRILREAPFWKKVGFIKKILPASIKS